jgi:hypothetical protein
MRLGRAAHGADILDVGEHADRLGLAPPANNTAMNNPYGFRRKSTAAQTVCLGWGGGIITHDQVGAAPGLDGTGELFASFIDALGELRPR